MENKIFVEKTFADCSLVPPKDATPPNFTEKTFANSHKASKFAKVFSLEIFTLYSKLSGSPLLGNLGGNLCRSILPSGI